VSFPVNPDIERARAELRFVDENGQKQKFAGAVPDQVRLLIALVHVVISIEERLTNIEQIAKRGQR
jgi:hypothetical protein